MKTHLYVNELIQWVDSVDRGKTERILWIDDDYCIAFFIDVNNVKAKPRLVRISEIIDALENGSAIKLSVEPWFQLLLDEELSEKERRLRDQAWKIIEPLVNRQPEIFFQERRGPMVQDARAIHGVSFNTVFKYLRRYWQRGQTPNSLIPDYRNSGGRGKMKKAGDKKRGRPRRKESEIGVDKNVDEDTLRSFNVAISRYYMNVKEISLSDTYALMVKDFYANEEERLIPTLDQFLYWYRKMRNIEKETRARKGDAKYELNSRPVLGSSTTGVVGPGSLYQIDATVGDVYLVSRYNRKWIIGRPVIYMIVDVFSRMITGLYVGLEGPSWLGAMMALSNAMSDKMKFCQEYQIEIGTEDWPCSYAPEAILADRGEMIGKNVETMIEFLQIKVQNTPPYRADWKGIVERNFRTINEKVKPLTPGFVQTQLKERGGPDYRLDARLDIYEFTKIIILCALNHNHNHWIDDYHRDEDMINDNVRPIPIELWKWGIENRSGKLRSFDEEIVRLNLMPRDNARVTGRGILFKTMRYSCNTAMRDSWFVKARQYKTWNVDISYDPRIMSAIYIRKDNGMGFEPCYLLDSETRYQNRSLDEIIYLLEVERLEKSRHESKKLLSGVNLLGNIEEIVQDAQDKTFAVIDPEQSKRSRIQGIGEQRHIEKEINRKTEAFVLGDKQEPAKTVVIPIEGKNSPNSRPAYNRRVNTLKKRMEEKKDDDDT